MKTPLLIVLSFFCLLGTKVTYAQVCSEVEVKDVVRNGDFE